MPRKDPIAILPNLPGRLKELRQEMGWTLADVAERLGVTQRAVVSNWEATNQRRRIPDIDNLLKLQRWYGVSMDYLLGQTSIERDSPGVKQAKILLRRYLQTVPDVRLMGPSDRARLALSQALLIAPDVIYLERAAAFLLITTPDLERLLTRGSWPADTLDRLGQFLGLPVLWFYTVEAEQLDLALPT